MVWVRADPDNSAHKVNPRLAVSIWDDLAACVPKQTGSACSEAAPCMRHTRILGPVFV